MTPLPAAILASQPSADVASNAQVISEAIDQAAAAGSRLLLTCECALCGYPGATRASLHDLDLCALAEWEDQLHFRARSHNLALFLGSVGRHPQAPESGFSNDLIACGAVENGLRYRKRCLTPVDHKHFLPGPAQPAVVIVDGWRLGLSICFDLRFGQVWSDLARAQCDAFLNSSYMAGPDPDPGTKASVIPALYTARATEWVTPLLLANCAADDRWLDSGAWDARGRRHSQTASGLITTTIHHRQEYAEWYQNLYRYAQEQLPGGE